VHANFGVLAVGRGRLFHYQRVAIDHANHAHFAGFQAGWFGRQCPPGIAYQPAGAEGENGKRGKKNAPRRPAAKAPAGHITPALNVAFSLRERKARISRSEMTTARQPLVVAEIKLRGEFHAQRIFYELAIAFGAKIVRLLV